MSPYAVKRASYNLAHELVRINDEKVGGAIPVAWRLSLVTGREYSSYGDMLSFAKLIVKAGR